MDTWDIFAIIGTIAFALQGALIAMEKKYDLFAVYLLGLLTAFGGGALQNVLIGGSDYQLWSQERLFLVAFIIITLAVIFPKSIVKSNILWTNILDAFGITSFAIQGSINALNLGLLLVQWWYQLLLRQLVAELSEISCLREGLSYWAKTFTAFGFF